MTFNEAIKTVCREHLRDLPTILSKHSYEFKHIADTYGGSLEDHQSAAVAATSWMCAKLMRLKRYNGFSVMGFAFPWKINGPVGPLGVRSEPIGDEYLWTMCIHNYFVMSQLYSLVERARKLQIGETCST